MGTILAESTIYTCVGALTRVMNKGGNSDGEIPFVLSQCSRYNLSQVFYKHG